MKKFVLAFATLAFCLSQAGVSEASWYKWTRGGTPLRILGAHTETVNGNISWVAYYLTQTEVIQLSNLDRPDMQALKKTLDDAFASGKRILRVENKNPNRAQTSALWYDAADNNVNVTFYGVQSGDQVVLRIVP